MFNYLCIFLILGEEYNQFSFRIINLTLNLINKNLKTFSFTKLRKYCTYECTYETPKWVKLSDISISDFKNLIIVFGFPINRIYVKLKAITQRSPRFYELY